ncbi:lytic murein transglycosylase [Stappia sp. F7233]|uniref:Lytic murein transglycosylase n=1 Tax=Stappia albiluteola TaxID=2758565 RepID=A0A839AHA5_9HYPH|nr:lytic murein transglycosylase [Stappia albiluteola]MBA5778314.1 lytic murein transglycosylase [Stappia albiluteola]
MLRIALFLACLAVLVLPAQAQSYQVEFERFLATKVVPAAKRAGISDKTLRRELGGLKPDTSLPGLARPGQDNVPPKVNYQAEFKAPASYFSEKQFNALVPKGRAILQRDAKLLDRIEKTYGVPRGILVAIWARETGYGAAKLPYDALTVVATRAFMGQRQSFYFEELIAALKILDQGYIGRAAFRASWGGALGQPQFLPSSFLKFAVDFDGDGQRDIWRSDADTLASIANYLKSHGWVTGRDWGFEIVLPAHVSCTGEGPDRGKPIADWAKAGVTRVKAREFPGHEVPRDGFLLLPAGRYGPAFLATENFYVLKAYNESDVYALFVGHLADRLSGGGGFASGWKAIPTATRGAVRKLQLGMEQQGHDVGGADGLIGFKTRRTLGLLQEKNGRAATCWID